VNSALDDPYFAKTDWQQRVDAWLNDPAHADAFLDGNVQLVRQIMTHADSGLRMVINITAYALLRFLADRAYRNLYESPQIGGERKQPSPERLQVDQMLGFGADAKDYYFGAVALGGTGVRFYGEYCMVIKPLDVTPDTQVIDRDSYDLLLPPLSKHSGHEVFSRIVGKWANDVVPMLTRKLLPDLLGTNRLITTGTVSEMILHDQEFVEVHKRGPISSSSIEEVRQSPDEIAMEARIVARGNAGFPPTGVELRWIAQRNEVVRALEAEDLQYRIVTLHGRGYQWR